MIIWFSIFTEYDPFLIVNVQDVVITLLYTVEHQLDSMDNKNASVLISVRLSSDREPIQHPSRHILWQAGPDRVSPSDPHGKTTLLTMGIPRAVLAKSGKISFIAQT